jgi:hypothetical protein
MFRALVLLCPSSGARQTAVAASGFRMNVEVDVFSAVVGLLTTINRKILLLCRTQTLFNMFRALLCPSPGARQTAVAASGFRMNVELDVFSAVVGLLTTINRKILLLCRTQTLLNMFWALLCPSSGAH